MSRADCSPCSMLPGKARKNHGSPGVLASVADTEVEPPETTGTLNSLATLVAAIAAPLIKEPLRPMTLFDSPSLRAPVTALVVSPSSSSSNSCTFLPLTPPCAFASSAASRMPSTMDVPESAAGPVSGSSTPNRTVSWASADDGIHAAADKASRALGMNEVFMPSTPWVDEAAQAQRHLLRVYLRS